MVRRYENGAQVARVAEFKVGQDLGKDFVKWPGSGVQKLVNEMSEWRRSFRSGVGV